VIRSLGATLPSLPTTEDGTTSGDATAKADVCKKERRENFIVIANSITKKV
jgi:hypothetical protein